MVVPNVFYRQGRAPLVDLSDLADMTNPDRRASVFATLGPMMEALTPAAAVADTEASMPPDQIGRLESALDLAGVGYRSELYVGAGHGFTMADTAAYDAEATERHWSALLDLLSRRLTE